MPLWLTIIIIISIVGGLGIAAFAMWLDVQRKQAKAGTMNSELAETVAAQQKLLEAAERRIQNLEAIVTSEAWDVERGVDLLPAKPTNAVPFGRIAASVLDDAPDHAEQAEQMARRVRS
ncbi:MAG: hypothetical protein AAF730_16750 [Bacteroidota bacterium]